MRNDVGLDKRAVELGQVVQEIVKRFECANVAAANGPHADLTLQETRVVELLGSSGGQMMRAVADHLGIAVNSVTSLADNLERKGLMRRVRSEADRRVVHVELTPAGQRACRSVFDVKGRFHREMLAALTDEEQAILLVLLRKIGGMQTAHAVAAGEGSGAAISNSLSRPSPSENKRSQSNEKPSVLKAGKS